MSWLAWIASYLLGSIPTGFLMAKATAGVDIRRAGSGNVGATNVARVVGKGPGLVVLAIDIAKGWLAVDGVGRFAGSSEHAFVCGVAAILGHIWTPWLRFQGGKGVATSTGVLLGWSPQVAGFLACVFVASFLTTHIVSISSVASAVGLPIALAMLGHPRSEIGLGAGLGALVLYTHRANLARLFRGEEKKLF